MYIPKHFENNNQSELIKFMRENSFCTIVSNLNGRLFATHIPLFLYQKNDDIFFQGHIAKNNPHKESFDGKQELLCIFSGHHSYISPNLYGLAKTTSVPTWNYTAVHAYGIGTEYELIEEKKDVLKKLILQYEGEKDSSWSMDQLDHSLINTKINGIFAFEIKVTRLEGKFKLSQNRTIPEQNHIRETLLKSDNPSQQGLGKCMNVEPNK